MSFQTEQSQEKEKRKRLAGWIPVLLLLFVLAVLANLRIREIRVTGNTNCDPEVLKELILPEGWERNTAVAFFKNRFLPHKAIPFVASYDVRLTGPDSCEIVVYEKAPLGYISYMSGFMYFDKDGTIIESSPERIEEIPEITGLKFGSIVLGHKLETESDALFAEIMNITQQLSTLGIPCRKIAFDSSRNVTLYIDDGDVRVKLGNGEELTAKLAVVGDVIGELRGRDLKGTLDLSSYRDRSIGGFIFVPDE